MTDLDYNSAEWAHAKELQEKIDNAHQAASETQRSWKHRCYAITDALGLDFGDPDFEMPDETSRREEAEKRAKHFEEMFHATEFDRKEAIKERDKWKASHTDLVDRNRILRDRHDLPVDRLPAHRRIVELQVENRRLQQRVDDLLEANNRYLNRARRAEEEIARLRAILAKEPNVFMIAYEDGRHQKLARAVGKLERALRAAEGFIEQELEQRKTADWNASDSCEESYIAEPERVLGQVRETLAKIEEKS